jgi:glycosyltransferase involved in cell wall biosynthesis
MPAYNAARFIREAIDSALAQEDVDLEVIVVDDESSDETPRILESYGSAIQVIRQTNAGCGPARNAGARAANGQWLALLDADDVWFPNKLREQLALATDEVGLIYSDCYNFGDVERVNSRQSDGVTLHSGEVFEQLLLDNFITASTVMMRKSWFDKLGGFSTDRHLAEDWDLWLRYAAEAPVRLCPQPLTRYRWHAGGISKRTLEMARNRAKTLDRGLALPRARRVPKRVINQALANVWECNAWFAARSHPRVACTNYLRSLWHNPWNPRAAKGIVKCLLGRA